jgi:hypothetical protein
MKVMRLMSDAQLKALKQKNRAETQILANQIFYFVIVNIRLEFRSPVLVFLNALNCQGKVNISRA